MSNTIPTSWVESPIERNPSYENRRRISPNPRKVFIVHGHDKLRYRYQLAHFLNQKGFESIILHEQSNGGRTIIEKLENSSADAGYAFILITPDDICNGQNLRARQNVILELGFFWGLLGRDRVCCLKNGEVELPSDMHGILYIPFKQNIEQIYYKMENELKNAGYNV
jgi:predicted nucleotide-binding protein